MLCHTPLPLHPPNPTVQMHPRRSQWSALKIDFLLPRKSRLPYLAAPQRRITLRLSCVARNLVIFFPCLAFCESLGLSGCSSSRLLGSVSSPSHGSRYQALLHNICSQPYPPLCRRSP